MPTPLAKFVRPAEIEDKISGVLDLEMPRLKALLGIGDRTVPQYLPSECLVHLMRRAVKQEDQAMMSAVLPILLKRCEAILQVKISDSAYRDPPALRKDILGTFAELLAENKPKLDFFECKFMLAFRNFYVDHARSEGRWSNRVVSFPDDDREGAPEDEESPSDWTVGADQERSASRKALKQKLMKAIFDLPEEERAAVIQVHVLGRDPAVVAAECGCHRRTIKNRIASAAKKLERFKEEL